jgi:hypothetical protein
LGLEPRSFWHSLRLHQDRTVIGFQDKFSFENCSIEGSYALLLKHRLNNAL